MAITGEAYGGSMLVQGWTTQNAGVAVGALSPDEEQGFGANSMLINPAAQWGYIGWSMITEDAITPVTHPTSTGLNLTRIFVPVSAVTSKVDIVFTTAGTSTVFYVGLYTTAGTQIAVTAESHASIALGLVTLNWATPVALTGGTFYYVSTNFTWSVAPVLASCQGASAAALNAGLTAATAESATNGTAAGAPPASLTMASNVFASYEWFLALH